MKRSTKPWRHASRLSMTKVAIVPEPTPTGETAYRAIAGAWNSVGKTAGQALDALTALLPKDEAGTVLVVQHQFPDRFFTARQQGRLRTLMTRWRAARDAGKALPPAEQAELDALSEAELRAATERTNALLKEASS